jgi:plasmid maintenance system antidote protein VapI
MTGKQYRKALAELGLTLTSAAEMFGVARKTSNRWAAGTTPVPWSTAVLLELMLNKHLELEFTFPACAERRLWRFQAEQTVQSI